MKKPFLLAVPFALLMGAHAAHGQLIIDDFDGGNDSGWTRFNPLGNAIYSFPGGNSYRIQAPISPDPGTFGPARAGAYRADEISGDFHVTVDLLDWDNSSDTHQAIGIFARASQIGPGTADGYFFHYDPYGRAGGATLWIDRITDESADFEAVSVSITRLDPSLDYRLEFTASGSELTGRVYELSNLSSPLYEISKTDSTYTSGYFGLLVADQGALLTGNQSADATFDNFSVTAVPEPMSAGLVFALTCIGAAAYVRRQRLNRA